MRLAPTTPTVSCRTNASADLDAVIHGEMSRAVGGLHPRHVVIKPNWVLHQASDRSPIAALVTDPRIIAATVRAVLDLYPGVEQVTVGDCPLQRADWPLLCAQSGLAPLIDELTRAGNGRVVFRDLRRDLYTYDQGRLVETSGAPHGDPLGYAEVRLGADSHLEEISDRADRFAIHDHDRAKTRANHRAGDHRYFVSRTFLDADLIINLPKWKTHSKSGLTGALKNLVGINGDKAYLPHFSKGSPSWGGDEYWDRGRWMYWIQNTLRDLLRSRLWWVYRAVRPFWLAFKTVRTALLRSGEGPPPDFYVGGGSWYGNATIWRMIYDLNMVLQRADAEGVLQPDEQRHYFCIVDGLVCGEGDGPLFPSPRAVDWIVCGQDPFAIDATLAWCMGFDPGRLPIIAHRHRFRGPRWGAFELADLAVAIDGVTQPLTAVDVHLGFRPSPGWIGHVERNPRTRAVGAPAA